MAIERFPDLKHQKRDDDNPAIQVFGRRFHKDQTAVEYLAEFLLVFISAKQISDADWSWERSFPSSDSLKSWPEGRSLRYAPPARLTLKLFSFLGSSTLETRHECHKSHFRKLVHELQSKVETSAAFSKGQVLDLLEQLLTGFTGVAKSRTWCAHTFLPITPGLIAREAIWEHTRAVSVSGLEWEEALNGNYFDFSKHAFMARGGEVLFLQLCNLFKRMGNAQLADFEHHLEYADGTGLALPSVPM